MKKNIITSIIVTLLLTTGCMTTQRGGGYSNVDDIYYNPKTDQANSDQTKFTERAVLDVENQKDSDKELAQLKRDYQQQTPNQNTDFNAIQQKYANILANDSIAETDTLLYANDETGYWVDGFEGSDMDRDYAERIVRFHGPFAGIPYWSPLYSEVVYGSAGWDMNVYVDGNYAWAFPSWSNHWYYNYYTSPQWSLSFGFGWPYYNRWGHYGGYYGWYDPWYSGYYPRYRYDYWYNRPGHYPGHGGGSHDHNWSYRPRNGSVTDGTSNSIRSSGVNRETKSGQTPGNTNINNAQSVYNRTTRRSYEQNSDNIKSTSPANSSYTRPSGTTSNDRTTRRSYTPTYSEPQGSTRPAYNNSSSSGSTSRSSSATQTKSTNTTNTGTRYQSSGSSTPVRSSGAVRSSGSTTKSYSSHSEGSSSGSSYQRSSGSSSGSYSGGSSSGGGSRSSSSGSNSGGGSSSGGSRSNRR